MAFFHAATDHELSNLRIFAGSGASIEERVRDREDVVRNWMNLGPEPHDDGRRRAVLLERSTHAIAWVVGDGETFGEVTSPTPEGVTAIERRFAGAGG